MPDETSQVLADYIAKSVIKNPKQTLAEDTRLISSGLIDSFSLVDLALFIEERFHVRVADTELNAQTFDTLAELATLVNKRRKK